MIQEMNEEFRHFAAQLDLISYHESEPMPGAGVPLQPFASNMVDNSNQRIGNARLPRREVIGFEWEPYANCHIFLQARG